MTIHLQIKSKLPATPTLLIYATVIYIIGIAGLTIDATRNLFIFLVPVNIAMAVIITLLYAPALNKKFFTAAALVIIGGYSVEWLGVKTGLVFGSYRYLFGLGPHVFEVPPIMGFNWFLLVYGVTSIASGFVKNKWLLAGIGALLMVTYDIFLEPSAIQYKFWVWNEGVIPFQNYVAWGILGYVFIVLFHSLSGYKTRNLMVEAMFWLQLGFFIILWIFNYLGN